MISATTALDVLAISGQHVAILAAVVFFGLRLLAVPPDARAGITILLTWLYIVIAGAPPSAIRAGVVATLVLAAKPLGRQVSPLHFLTTMLAAVLAYNPLLAYSTGFQLSVAAVLGILLLREPLNALVERTVLRPFQKPPRVVCDLVSISLAAQISTTPIVAATFNEVSTIGVFTNLVAVPISGPILTLGLLGSVFGNLAPILAYPLNAFESRQHVPFPQNGTEWRINFSRVEWTPGKPREDNWVWSPQGLIDMHVPEHWGYLHFTR